MAAIGYYQGKLLGRNQSWQKGDFVAMTMPLA
jgi:hypothetical protein